MKKMCTLVSAIALACLLCVPAFADWEVNEDTAVTKYQKPNGEYAAAEWMDIDGKQYYFYTTGEMATGWVKNGDDWYYCEPTGERRYTDLKTDVFTFKIDKKTGVCSNFTENTTPSEQAGWIPTSASYEELLKDSAKGNIVYYNGQWWTTPSAAWIMLNPEVTYFHDINPDSKPYDRFALADLDIVEEPKQKEDSLTGLWW